MQKGCAIQRRSDRKEREDYAGPCRHQPIILELEVQQSHNRSSPEISHKRVEAKARILLRAFLSNLRIDEEKNQRDRQHGVHARSPEVSRSTCGEVRKENSCERRHQSHVRLKAELLYSAHQPILEQHQAEY